jgi:hypothetical protein
MADYDEQVIGLCTSGRGPGYVANGIVSGPAPRVAIAQVSLVTFFPENVTWLCLQPSKSAFA